MDVDNCYWLDYSALKKTSRDSNFGTSYWFLFWSTSLFVLSNSFIVFGDNTSSLYPVFVLKKIMFLIL